MYSERDQLDRGGLEKAPATKRVPAVFLALKQASSAIGQQMEAITALEQRLEPVLRLEPTPSQAEKDLPPPPGIAGGIDALTRDVSQSTARLVRLLSLLEI